MMVFPLKLLLILIISFTYAAIDHGFDDDGDSSKSDSCQIRKNSGSNVCKRVRLGNFDLIKKQKFAFSLIDSSIVLNKRQKRSALDLDGVFTIQGASEVDQVIITKTDEGHIIATIPMENGVYTLEPCATNSNDSKRSGNRCYILVFNPYSNILPEPEPVHHRPHRQNNQPNNRRQLRYREYTGDYLCSNGTLSTDSTFCCLKSCSSCATLSCSGSCCGIGITNSCRDFNAPCSTVAVQKVVVAFTGPVVNEKKVNMSYVAANAISITNQGYSNSRIPIQLQLQEYYMTSIAGDITPFDPLVSNEENLLTNYLNSPDFSNHTGADFHVIIYYRGAYCGLAWDVDCLGGVCVAAVNEGCITNNYSFGHEIGHLQGTAHNVETGNGAPARFPYARGYYMGHTARARTILCYPMYTPAGLPSTRINWFSNPKVSVTSPAGTFATGTPTANSALGLFSSRYEHSSITLPGIVIALPSATQVGPVIQNLFTCTRGSKECPTQCLICPSACIADYFVVYNYTVPKTSQYYFTTENPNTTCADTYLYIRTPTSSYCPTDLIVRDYVTISLEIGQNITIMIGSPYNECSMGQTVSISISEITGSPTVLPTFPPSQSPSTSNPSLNPTTTSPTSSPTSLSPTRSPSISPSKAPINSKPTNSPTISTPTKIPSSSPSKSPTTSQPTQAPKVSLPTISPSRSAPTFSPSLSLPTRSPSVSTPSRTPSTSKPTISPSKSPSRSPSKTPTSSKPSFSPSRTPTSSKPTKSPTRSPTSQKPTKSPSMSPTKSPSTTKPTFSPTKSPSISKPSASPTKSPSNSKPTISPTRSPSHAPTSSKPTNSPTRSPSSQKPTRSPSTAPTKSPSNSKPTKSPTKSPSTSKPSGSPTKSPSNSPIYSAPSSSPIVSNPTTSPKSSIPTRSPTTSKPTKSPTKSPSNSNPTNSPTKSPVYSLPTISPSSKPTASPTKVGDGGQDIGVSPTTSPTVLSLNCKDQIAFINFRNLFPDKSYCSREGNACQACIPGDSKRYIVCKELPIVSRENCGGRRRRLGNGETEYRITEIHMKDSKLTGMLTKEYIDAFTQLKVLDLSNTEDNGLNVNEIYTNNSRCISCSSLECILPKTAQVCTSSNSNTVGTVIAIIIVLLFLLLAGFLYRRWRQKQILKNRKNTDNFGIGEEKEEEEAEEKQGEVKVETKDLRRKSIAARLFTPSSQYSEEQNSRRKSLAKRLLGVKEQEQQLQSSSLEEETRQTTTNTVKPRNNNVWEMEEDLDTGKKTYINKLTGEVSAQIPSEKITNPVPTSESKVTTPIQLRTLRSGLKQNKVATPEKKEDGFEERYDVATNTMFYVNRKTGEYYRDRPDGL